MAVQATSRGRGQGKGRGANLAHSPEQYRLAQAVLSGTARDARMPVKVARELVERTPAKLRSEWSRSNPKSPSLMTAGEINKALDRIDAASSKLTSEFIAAGRGHERPSEYLKMNDPLANRAKELFNQRSALQMEKELRYGPGAPSRLPKGFGPRKQNPGAEKVYLWGYHRIRGTWERLQGPSDAVTMEQYKPYFERETLSQSYANVPHSGFANDSRPTYSKFVIAGKAPRKSNPEGGAESMYSSFHGTPSTAIDEYEEQEHYHSNLAALGELVGLKVRTVSGYDVTLGFESGSGRESNPKTKLDLMLDRVERGKREITFDVRDWKRADVDRLIKTATDRGLDASSDGKHVLVRDLKKSNPGFWPFNSLTRTTVMHVPSGHKFHTVSEHKHHTIYKSESKDGYVVPGIERDSVFDSVKDAKKFIDHWVKARPNPGLGRDYVYPDEARVMGSIAEGEMILRSKRSGSGRKMSEAELGAVRRSVDNSKRRLAELQAENDAKYGKRDNPKHGGPFASSQRFVGDTIGTIYRPIDAFTGMVAGAADKGLRAVGVKGNKGKRKSNPDHTLLTSNENGTQLYFVGGQQDIDLDSLKIDGEAAKKDLVTIGQCWGICYKTTKKWSEKEIESDIEYVHIFGKKETKPKRGGDLWEDAVPPPDAAFYTDELPTLTYDRLNEKQALVGGSYKIDRPLFGVSPGIEG